MGIQVQEKHQASHMHEIEYHTYNRLTFLLVTDQKIKLKIKSYLSVDPNLPVPLSLDDRLSTWDQVTPSR